MRVLERGEWDLGDLRSDDRLLLSSREGDSERLGRRKRLGEGSYSLLDLSRCLTKDKCLSSDLRRCLTLRNELLDSLWISEVYLATQSTESCWLITVEGSTITEFT